MSLFRRRKRKVEPTKPSTDPAPANVQVVPSSISEEDARDISGFHHISMEHVRHARSSLPDIIKKLADIKEKAVALNTMDLSRRELEESDDDR